MPILNIFQESDKLLVKLERSLDANNENDNQPTRGVKRPAQDVIQDPPNPVPQPAPENGSPRIFSYVPHGDNARRPVVIGPAGPSQQIITTNTPASQAGGAGLCS